MNIKWAIITLVIIAVSATCISIWQSVEINDLKRDLSSTRHDMQFYKDNAEFWYDRWMACRMEPENKAKFPLANYSVRNVWYTFHATNIADYGETVQLHGFYYKLMGEWIYSEGFLSLSREDGEIYIKEWE